MPGGFLGRMIILERNGVPIAGVQEKSVSINGEAIDVSADDSAGWRELLPVHGEKQVDISVSGILKDKTFKTKFFADELLELTRLIYPDGGVLEGMFLLVSTSDTGPYKDKATFEASLQSSGAITYLAGV